MEPDADERAKKAFERAVARERGAIAAHERAAVAEDEAAAVIEDQASRESDAERKVRLLDRAQADRDRADRARGRAAKARARLEAELGDDAESAGT